MARMGYRFESKPEEGRILVRDEPLASIIQKGLEGFASERFQRQAEVKRFLKRSRLSEEQRRRSDE
jgi:hypothetical protein